MKKESRLSELFDIWNSKYDNKFTLYTFVIGRNHRVRYWMISETDPYDDVKKVIESAYDLDGVTINDVYYKISLEKLLEKKVK